MATKEDEYKKLRSYLNKSIRGKNTDAILKALATGPVHLINNVEAVNDSLYIVSASERFLDQRLGDKGVVRPPEVGLSDEVFREIGIEITNRKQVRDLVHQLLRILYGEIFTRATSPSFEVEPYALEDGDNLIISFDDTQFVEVVFTASQFQNINAASAQEVSDAITKSIRKAGRTGAAFSREEEGNYKVVLISSTDGPSSSVRVLGGKAQNILKFDQIRPTSGDSTTQWTLTQEAGGNIRATWTGGADPALGRVKVGDYINLYGSAFDLANRGTFDVVAVQGGSAGVAYVEYNNPNGIAETTLQGAADAMLFFNAKKRILTTNNRYAAAFQTSPRTIEVFMPATTRVVRRDRKGAAHIYGDSTPSATGQEGPYLYDTTVGYVLSESSAATTETLNVSSDSIMFVDDASSFPDDVGNLMIGFGTSHQEGPVPYISRPSSQTIRINPSYKFKKNHPIGSDVSLLSTLSPPSPNKNGTDTPFFLTDSVAGRIYAENLIKEITATGIVVVIYILYPNDIGLGNYYKEPELSEKYYIWGTEEDI
jgi:L-lactate utilization protein LutC